VRSRTAPSREIKYVELVDQIDTPGPARAVAVSGDFAHVAAYTSSLRIIDVSDPAHPAEASVYDAPSKAYEVKVIGNRAYVGDVGTYFNGHYEVTGMIIVDVSDPHTPVEIGTWKTGGEPRGIEVAGSYAYVANSCPATGAKGLRIVDITNPVTPTESSFFETPGCALDLTVTGEYAYVAAQTYGLNVVDIQDPEHPMLAGQRETDNLAVDVAVEGNWACVAGAGYAFPETRGLWIMDVSDLQNITAPGFYNTPSTAEAVIVEGGYAFVAAFSRGLRLIDVSDPEAPAEVAFHETPGSSWNLDLVGNYVYVAEDQGLAILRILHDKARGLIPLEGGTLASSSGGTRLDFPSESFTRAISLAYGHLWRDQESEPMAGIGRTFELTAVHADSGLPAQLVPGKSFTPTIVATPDHLSLWAVLGETRRVYLPLILRQVPSCASRGFAVHGAGTKERSDSRTQSPGRRNSIAAYHQTKTKGEKQCTVWHSARVEFPTPWAIRRSMTPMGWNGTWCGSRRDMGTFACREPHTSRGPGCGGSRHCGRKGTRRPH
jgi:hypothetical protein